MTPERFRETALDMLAQRIVKDVGKQVREERLSALEPRFETGLYVLQAPDEETAELARHYRRAFMRELHRHKLGHGVKVEVA